MRLAAKIILGILTAGLLAFAWIAVTNEILFQLTELAKYTFAQLLLMEIALFVILFSAWAIFRDGLAKGLFWTLLFATLGGPGAGIYVLWNLRNVKSNEEMKGFFLGRHVLREPSKEGSKTAQRTSQQVPLPA